MTIWLLVLIYIIFISLGLPDSVLGSSFPAIAENLNISKDYAGYIGMVVTSCTIISSFSCDFLTRKLSEKWLVFISILFTSTGLFLYSFVKMEYVWLFYLAAIPLGLGAGCIDACLNNYVALHYKAIHMNWLHCCWGIGASVSPLIIGSFIDSSNHSEGWQKGIIVVASILVSIAALSLLCIPLWSKVANNENLINKTKEEITSITPPKPLFQNTIFYLCIIAFFCYCGLETSAGFWSATYFQQTFQIDSAKAASLAFIFYFGITIGRFVCGFISLAIKEKALIRAGELILLIGTILMMTKINLVVSCIGMALSGIGCAPIYPAIIRLTPYRFSKVLSQKAMGLEMAFAYIGNLAVSPLFGVYARFNQARFSYLPYLIFILAMVMIILHEIINLRLYQRDKSLTNEELEQYKVKY